ncbi:MAG: OmpA family protein [Candidatus Hydrogenedens sp.]|nr:OmpA family protein [Candidatus Hydrogenedens sp.]
MRWMPTLALVLLLGLGAAGLAAAQDEAAAEAAPAEAADMGVEVIPMSEADMAMSEEEAQQRVWWGNRSISKGNYIKFEKFVPDCPGICDRCDQNMICCDTGCPCEKCNYICDDCDNCMIWDKIFFDLDKSVLRSDGIAECEKILAYMNENPNVHVMIQGHTCDLAPDAYNVALGQRRANSVMHWLEEHGIPSYRMRTHTYGETTPWVGTEIRYLNRRAVVVVDK